VAQALTEQFPDTIEQQPEVLAQHYTEAGLTVQALDYWHQAGARAHRLSAYAEAIAHCTRGLEVLKTVPETPERNQHELQLLSRLRSPIIAVQGYGSPALAQITTRVHALYQQIDEPRLRLAALNALKAFYIVREMPTALALSEQCLALGERLQQSHSVVAGHVHVGEVLLYRGEPARCLASADQGLALYDPQQHRPQASGGVQDMGATAHRNAALALWYLGYPAQSLRRMQQALAQARALDHPYTLASMLTWAFWLHVLRREPQAAWERAAAYKALSAEYGVAVISRPVVLDGWRLVEQGHVEEGIRLLRQGLTALQDSRTLTWVPSWLVYLADAYRRLGQSDAGLHLIAEALAVMDASDIRWMEAEVYRIKGELLARDGPRHTWVEAEACFQQALAVARRQQARSLELRAAMSLSRLWQRQGKREAARALVAGLYEWFTEGFETVDLQEARALLEALR